MRYLKKGILVRCSHDPKRIDIYNIVLEDGDLKLEPVEFGIENWKDKIKHAVWITLDFFYTYVYNNKKKPRIQDLITILSYELSISEKEAWEIFEILNWYGVILIDKDRFYLNVP